MEFVFELCLKKTRDSIDVGRSVSQSVPHLPQVASLPSNSTTTTSTTVSSYVSSSSVPTNSSAGPLDFSDELKEQPLELFWS